MPTEHFLPGKDASLEQTITTLQAKLAARGYTVEECSWLNPVENVWSVHVRNPACPLMFTNGKGASELAARASALGEFFERLSCNYFWNHYYLGDDIANREFAHYPRERWFSMGEDDAWPEGLLTPELQAFYNPEGSIPAEALVDLNTGHYERGICAIPYVCQRSGQEVFFPVNLISNLYVSNGMSAGNTPMEARAQALSEILERHVKFKVIAEGLCLPEVPEDVIARYPGIAAGIQGLREAGFGILVKDASLGGQYPVMCVTMLNPKDQGIFASFGAHPRFEVALERALTELLQGRALAALDGFPPPSFVLEDVASAPNIEIHFVDSSGEIHWNFLNENPDFEFVDWNFTDTRGSTTDDNAWLMNCIHHEGYDIYVADFDHLGVYACRILVPGMSEIYPVDDLEWENNSVGALVRPAILNLADLDDNECTVLLDTLNEQDVVDEKPVAALIGLAPDPDTLWADLRVGELKLLLALAIADSEGVIEGCEWVDQFEQLDPYRRRVYQCIQTLLAMDDPNAYELALESLYGAEVLDMATDLIDGEVRFFGLSSPTLDLNGCALHQSLLNEYQKAHSWQ